MTDFPAVLAAEVARLEDEARAMFAQHRHHLDEAARLSAALERNSDRIEALIGVAKLYPDTAAIVSEPVVAEVVEEPEEQVTPPADAEIVSLAPAPAPATRALTEQDHTVIKLLAAEGHECDAIARRLGVRDHLVGQVLHDLRKAERTAPPKAPIWTPEDDDRILEMRQQGKVAKEIAAATGRTVAAVERRFVDLRRAGRWVERGQVTTNPSLRADGYTPEDDAKLLAMWADGAASTVIAAELGRTDGSVRMRVKTLRARGVEIPVRPTPRPMTLADRPEILRRAGEGETAGQIAHAMGLHLKVVSGMLSQLQRRNAEAPSEVAPQETPAPVPPPIAAPVVVAIRPAPPAAPPALIDLPSGQRAIARHLDQIGYPEPWSPANDLALVEAILAGFSFSGTAERLGLTSSAAVGERWEALRHPILREVRQVIGPMGARRTRTVMANDVDGQAHLLAELRRRAAEVSQAVAAE